MFYSSSYVVRVVNFYRLIFSFQILYIKIQFLASEI